MPRPDTEDHSDFFLIAFLVIVALLALGGGGLAVSNRDPVPVDDYTGLCNRPTAQLGC